MPALDSRPVHHEGTRQVMTILLALLAHCGWLSTSEIAATCEMHKDTVRKMLRELATDGWVRLTTADGIDLWQLGPELPRIGIQFHEVLAQRAAVVRADLDRTLSPLGRP